MKRTAFTLLELLVVMAVAGLLASLLLPALGRVREIARRACCAKLTGQVVAAQLTWSSDRNTRGQTETFIRGFESFAPGEIPIWTDLPVRTNGSRAFAFMARQNRIDNLSALVCPSDPFVAALDGDGSRFGPADVDLHGLVGPLVEGQPIGPNTPFASARSPAATEAGHTFFSYSMQSGNGVPSAHLGPALSSRIPVVGDRNPWCLPIMLITGQNDASVANPEGNSYNHGREGANLGFVDGRVEFQESARSLEMPMRAGPGAAMGFDYIYDSRSPSPAPRTVTSADGRCPTREWTTGIRSPRYTSWLTD